MVHAEQHVPSVSQCPPGSFKSYHRRDFFLIAGCERRELEGCWWALNPLAGKQKNTREMFPHITFRDYFAALTPGRIDELAQRIDARKARHQPAGYTFLRLNTAK